MKIITRIKLAYVRYQIERKRRALYRLNMEHRKLSMELVCKTGKDPHTIILSTECLFYRDVPADIKISGKHYAYYPARQLEEDIKELQKEETKLKALLSD